MASEIKVPQLCTGCQRAGIEPPNELNPRQALNSISRLDNKTYVCSACGHAEAIADETGASFEEVRNQVQFGLL